MEITFYCKVVDLNWVAVTELPSHLRKYGLEVERSSLHLIQYPEMIDADSLDYLLEYVKRKGPPRRYTIYLHGTEKKTKTEFSMHFSRAVGSDGYIYMAVSLKSENPEEALRSAMNFLGLHIEEPLRPKTELSRTAFIAHRFDKAGEEAAEKLARFLSLLGFDCITGRGYAPGSIAEKVKSRLTSQALVVVILTPGDDSTWLVQESLLSSVSGKPLVLLKESKANYKPALLSDHEFIPFSGSRVEQTFIPLLEGLKALEYKFCNT